MDGASRIGGYGGYTGTGGRKDRSASLARFCRGRRVGDVVSGIFLRPEAGNLGWAQLEGEELLAHLPESMGGDGPLPGERVFFRIEALAPEVLLRMLCPTDPQVDLAVLLPPVPLSREAALYAAARDKLDAALTAAQRKTPGLFAAPDLARRKEAFIRLAAAAAEVAEPFAETLARSFSLSRAAGPTLVFFRHLPWLCGAVTRLEVALWRDEACPLTASARLPSGELLCVRGRMEERSLRYRLARFAPDGRVIREEGAPAPVAGAEYMGSDAALPSAQAVDMVGRILALAAGAGHVTSSGFSRKL